MKPRRTFESRPGQGRRTACRPMLERLEERSLLSVAGGPDLTFGTGNGYAEPPPSPVSVPGSGTYGFYTTASVVQPNGDVVSVGRFTLGTDESVTFLYADSFYATRFTPNGQPDSGFQQTPLINAPNLTATYYVTLETSYSGATGVALESTGQIVVVGEINNIAKVVELNSDGTLDTSFGTDGIVTLGTVGAGDTILDYASAVSILPGGLIAVAGSSSPTSGHDTPAVEVLKANGTIDTSYGTNGLAVVPLPAGAQAFAPIVPALTQSGTELTSPGPLSLVQQADGSLVVAADAVPTGGSGVEEVVTRLTTAGATDSTFGTGGQVVITPQSVFPYATSASTTALAIQSNGDLIVGGQVELSSTDRPMEVVRLTTSGAFDPLFGVGGVNILPSVTTFNYPTVGAIAIQSDGKIVLANKNTTGFARLDADGLPDTTFGTAGQSLIYQTPPTLMTGPPGTGIPNLSGTVGLSIAANGEFVAVNSNGGLYRLLAQGASGDYDGDGISDRAIYIYSTGSFAYTPSSGVIGPIIQFGPAGPGQSLPAPGAYGGEGQDELGVYIPSLGAFAIMPLHGGTPILAPFGTPGLGNSLPAPGDYDASGATELGVYLPNLGVYAYRPVNGGTDVYIAIGQAGAGKSIPVPADYFGTGQDDVAVYEPATASYVIRNPVNGQIYTIPGFGIPGTNNSIPVPGDYDGSGYDELAVYLPSLGELIYRPAAGGPDVTIPFGTPGIGKTLPAPGDYDGSGKTEVAAYLPTLGIFAYRPAVGVNDVYQVIGPPNQTVPYVLASATDVVYYVPPPSPAVSAASVEVPLTPDVLDTLDGLNLKKKAGPA
jgi:uncharacterized delta-60 repeat protein